MIEVADGNAIGHVAKTMEEAARSDEIEAAVDRSGQCVIDQHGDGSAGGLSDGHVRLAVAVEVARSQICQAR